MRNFVWAALAAGCLLTGVGVASAGDTIRLGGPSAQSAIQGGTDTELVHGRRGYYGGGYHGGGYYGRGYYGGGFYRPYYAGYYARPYYYQPTYYYTPAYYPSYYSSYYEYNRPAYYPSVYYAPIAGEQVSPPAMTLQYQAPAPRPYGSPMPPATNGNGTFQYDGGPRSPIPMPNPDANPSSPPRGIIPIDGRLVSLPTGTSGGTTQVNTVAQQPTTTGAPRVTYPAYGEEPITPAPRKTNRYTPRGQD